MPKPEAKSLRAEIEEQGIAIVSHVLNVATVERLRRLVDAGRERDNSENVANSSGTYALRNLTDVVPEIADVLRQPRLVQLVESVVGAGAFMTRATLFDKTPGANWGVFWHQDLSIAVKEKHDVPGFAAWTRKAGVQCVQPPMELMRQVLAIRLHLDDCTSENGALKVLPGTHGSERLSTADVDSLRAQNAEVICEIPAGGALLMRPLLLHASSPMEIESHRRVIHFEFANFELPAPLQWMYRIPCGRVN